MPGLEQYSRLWRAEPAMQTRALKSAFAAASLEIGPAPAQQWGLHEHRRHRCFCCCSQLPQLGQPACWRWAWLAVRRVRAEVRAEASLIPCACRGLARFPADRYRAGAAAARPHVQAACHVDGGCDSGNAAPQIPARRQLGAHTRRVCLWSSPEQLVAVLTGQMPQAQRAFGRLARWWMNSRSWRTT